MKLSLGRAGALALGLFVGGGVLACADSTEPAAEPGDTTQVDSGAPEASASEDASDAGRPVRDAAVDAGPKECSDDGFCPTTLPAGQTVQAFWGDGTGVVWGGTAEGELLRWDGNEWHSQASELGSVRVIWGSSPTDIWVGTDDSIFHGTGASSTELTFERGTLPGWGGVTSILGLSANDVWAIGGGRVLHYAGAEWVEDSGWSPDISFERVWGSAEMGVWAGGGRPLVEMPWVRASVAVQRDGAGGLSEYALPPDPDPKLFEWEKEMSLLGAVATSPTKLTVYSQSTSFSVRPSRWVGTSNDGGKTFTFTWAEDERTDTPKINALFGVAANDIWAAGDYGRLLHWDGSEWSPTAVSLTGWPVTDPFYSVWVRGNSEMWVGGKGMALRFDASRKKTGGSR